MANLTELAIEALADPTRRTIFEAVAARPSPVGAIAAGLPISRPAVSQHLKVLKAARLVSERADGTRRIYSIDPRGIAAVRAWLDGFWVAALADFQRFADSLPEEDP